MWGTIVLLLVIGAVLYLLWANDKLNTNSINESSGQSGGDSIQFTNDGRGNLRINNARVKNLRIAHSDNAFSKVSVTEQPITYDQIVDQGDRIGANTVFLGIIDAPLSGPPMPTRTSANVVVKQFKNMFIIFKGVDYSEIDNNTLMVRYESNKMVYALVDASNSTLPELLRDVSYPICVLTNNSSAQLVLKEWGYTQVNDASTLFVKNEKSFRLQ
ncbi:occlusion derived virus envelope protein 25 [Phthorimaea operculella granulovirus]|uniref:Occlusion derived virus envelope protein 25 n=2 Tax=Phthorimaea operculella granulovirus TaxID=192584 RepID=Q8JRX6_9BBAC|nr:occlusion derived virus envelope protein 25 [Phthorimaea operculella granulovirus]AAM70281.1 occlusion derived virus envelope protein 25 [Phthorimaea operculella granulovirus]ANY57472.1 occlusion derived virus envelope protein 25 [Phthorimaea operculella granulovirus]QBH65918.1 occlusion derived virus envelope protein 25 [Phthorimaea operculella granulovirus]QBH66048.1 occlusion derived virus envelope protein 25 [Phthorimaea operculella granulovirus]QBH66178.1 occlusion derived virus envelo